MTQWQEFLQSQGAHIVNGQTLGFADQQDRMAEIEGHLIADLSHLALLQVEGDDAVTFLQGQLTNDIQLLNGANSFYAGYCTPKGRLLALFLAFAHQGHIHLQLNAELLEPIVKRLKMFILRSKVTISDVSADIVRLGVSGSNSHAILEAIFDNAPIAPHQMVSLEEATIIRLPGPLPRFEIFTRIENAPEIWRELEQHFSPVGKNLWDEIEIRAGVPEIYPSTQEAFVPQMVNLDAINGISFKKGCYTGQEIVARTHYLGKVKRRTLPAFIPGNVNPQPGDSLHDVNGQEAGQLVRTAPVTGGCEVLAEVRLESLDIGGIRWQNTPLALQELPYDLP